MSPAQFEIAFRPSAGVRVLRGATLALGLAGMLLAWLIADGHQKAAYLLAFGALMLYVAWLHGRRGLAWGVLRIAPDGQAQWRADASDRFIPVAADRWSAGERLIWIRLRDVDGGQRELLLARGSVDDESWRRLAGWLTWLRRGRAAA